MLISKMDPIKYVFEKQALSGRISRWQMVLTEYDIQYVSQKAIKGSVLSEYLAEQPIEDYQSMRFDFPDKDIMYLKMKDWEEPSPDEGEWETRQPNLIPYMNYARRLLPFFEKVELHHVPRAENQMADALATLSSMYKVNFWNEAPRIVISRLDRPAFVFAIDEASDDKPWYFDIQNFLKNKEYPAGASSRDQKTLRRLVGNFYLNLDDVLYKRNHDLVLLRCVDEKEAKLLLKR